MGTSFTNPLARTAPVKLREGSELRSPRDSDSVPRVWQKGMSIAQQIARVCQEVEQLQRELNRLRMRKGGPGAAAPAAQAGMVFRGLWSATEVYQSQHVVFRTPTGGSAGVYIALLNNIPMGQQPEIGAPYWAAFPYPPPGVWG